MTRVIGEVDALSNAQFESFESVLERIEANRIARLNATGMEYLSGEEADWLLSHMVPAHKAHAQARAAICAWLRNVGGEQFVEDIEDGVYDASA